MLKPSLELLPIVFSLDNSVVVVYSASFVERRSCHVAAKVSFNNSSPQIRTAVCH